MRWCVHVLGRLAIAATCTNSAAAPEARVDRGEYLSSAYSMWEHIMSNSAQSANRMATRYTGQARELRLEAREKTCAARDNPAQALQFDPGETVSSPSIMPAVMRADHEDAGPWSSVFAPFGRAFALHGTSYCNLLHAIATSPVESCSVQTEKERLAVRERRSSLAVISPSASPKPTESSLSRRPFDPRRGPKMPVDRNLQIAFVDRSVKPPQLANRALEHIASRWVRWRREREIKRPSLPW